MSRPGHWMYAKYDSRCAECNRYIYEDEDRIFYLTKEHAALCETCGREVAEPPDDNIEDFEDC